MVELVGKRIASAFRIGWCSAWDPWMTFVHMLAVAVFIGVTGVEAMFGAVELDLVPFSSLCIFD